MMMTTTTTSWRRRRDDDLFYVDYSTFHPKTLTRKIPFYRAVILSPPPWNLEFCSLFGWFEFEPRLHFTALNMTYLFILLLILFRWRRWWWWWRRRDDVVSTTTTTTTSWRRRDAVVTTTSWRRRIFYVDYSVSAQNVNEKNAVLPSGYFIPASLKPWVLFFVWVI